MTINFTDAVRNFANGVRMLFRELYKTPPGC
jgi:hypothetical protein